MVKITVTLLLFLAPRLFAHLPTNRAPAGLMMSQADALKWAFPAGFTRRTHFLETEQSKRAEALAGGKLPSTIVVAYSDAADGGRSAFFERVGVGQASLTVMALVNRDGSLAEARILAADLPSEFLPPAPWLARWQGRRSPELSWTSQGLPKHHEAHSAAEAVFAVVRRSLALYEALLSR